MFRLTQNINKNSRTFLKFLISYIAILIIPVIILSVILNNYLMRIIKDEAVRSNMDALTLSKHLLDKEIHQIHGISYKLLYTNTHLSGYFALDKGYERNALISNELKDSIFSNLFISEVALYTSEDSVMYTSNGSYSLGDFFKKIYKYEHYNRESFLSDISSISKMQLVPVQNVNTSERYVTALYPSHSFALKPKPSLVFLIQENKFLEYVNPKTNIPGANSIIIDEFYNIIVASNDNDYIHTDDFQSNILSFGEESGYTIIHIKNEDYFLFVGHSDVFSLKYVSMLPVHSVYGKVYEARLIISVGLLLIVILGAGVIYYFMMVNYFPIRQLSTNINRMFQVHNSGDELETVKKAINYLSDQNTSLNARLRESVENVRDAVIFSLLKGQIDSLEEFNEYGRDIGLSFSLPCFYISLIYAESKSQDEITHSNITALVHKSVSTRGYSFYCRDNIEKNQFIVVINTAKRDDEGLRSALDAVRVLALEELKCILTIGIGNAYYDLKLLPHSFIEASTALKHRFIKGNDQIIPIDSLAKDWNYIEDYPRKEAAELKSNMKQRNITKVESCINSMAAYIKNSSLPIFMARGFCFDIINDIMQAGYAAADRNDFPDVFYIESAGTVDELFNIIKGVCIDICNEQPEERYTKNNTELIEQINEYIKQNYYKCDFSIQGVSDYFNMKLSYMSQYFKTQTGKTIMDYVTGLRVERAKKLLVTTKLPLNTVSEEVGYYNVSSFIRRFKQVTLTTPGEYRKEYVIDTGE